MAGEIIKSEGICLSIHPWSRTSHVVTWLTPEGRVTTLVKGAVRPKSAFLGQYDLNYTCEILYYARAKGELHALRECRPLLLRDNLRVNFRALMCAEHFRSLVYDLAPMGPECREWYRALTLALDTLNASSGHILAEFLAFELEILSLSGLAPDFSGYDNSREWNNFSIEHGVFGNDDGRQMRVSKSVADALLNPLSEKSSQILLDAARVIGVFYNFHLDRSPDARRSTLSMISK